MKPATILTTVLATVLTGCASRSQAPESAISREARARWTAAKVREMANATRHIVFPPTQAPLTPPPKRDTVQTP